MVHDLPQPRAARLRRPSWRDSRLLVGVVLVLASVAVGSRLVASLDRTVPVWAAASTLPSGRVLAAADLQAVNVHLGSSVSAYLTADRPAPVGAVLQRTVGAGELVPSAALSSAGTGDRRAVSIPVAAPVPEALRAGAAVDVWSSAKETTGTTGGYRAPVRLAQGAPVVAVTGEGSQLGVARGASVQVLLPPDQLTAVLDALANGAKVALVPGPEQG